MTAMRKINDRLEDILTGGGGLCAEPGEITFRTYITNPDELCKPESVLAYDRAATAAINRLESIIADLNAYRVELGKRYAYLETNPTIPVVKLLAKSDGKKTYYYLKTYRRYANGVEYEEHGRQFLENERDIALKEFAGYKKTHPGIVAEMDI